MGEKNHWGKFDPWLESTRVPFIIVPPKDDLTYEKGNHLVNAPVNLLDVYPTLVSMCSLPDKSNLEGNDLSPILKETDTPWDKPSISTVGRGTQSIILGTWHYIHYFDGSEELYDMKNDPNEWTNLAKTSEYKKLKSEMKSHIVEDKRIKQYIRYGDWKAVVNSDDEMMLFDFSVGTGISEQKDLSASNSKIVKQIRTYLARKNITDRYLVMPVN